MTTRFTAPSKDRTLTPSIPDVFIVKKIQRGGMVTRSSCLSNLPCQGSTSVRRVGSSRIGPSVALLVCWLWAPAGRAQGFWGWLRYLGKPTPFENLALEKWTKVHNSYSTVPWLRYEYDRRKAILNMRGPKMLRSIAPAPQRPTASPPPTQHILVLSTSSRCCFDKC